MDSLIQVDDQSDGMSGAEEHDLVDKLNTFDKKKDDKKQKLPTTNSISGL